ncbi:MAG TPA: DNA polymerase IV [Thermoanaerobaculia bacterium]|nr:DNA polymerase IV [Thermoanaerobaculia bacterium]
MTRDEPRTDRRILHCDMDCFYAAIHQRDDPSLRGRPVVVGGDPESRGVVAAASYEARRFGIRSAMPSAQARRLCAATVFLRPEFSRYREESRRVFEIFRTFTALVQAVSIDEGYLDVTEAYQPYGSATAVARAIRERVRGQTGLTVSVGVGPNRLVAKIASDCNKPDGLTVVPPHRVFEFLGPLAVRKLQGVGPATERILAEELDVRTVAQLREVPLERLVSRLGRYGTTLHRFARGVDDRPVETRSERKSYSSERTYERDLRDYSAVERELVQQAHEVAAGLARHRLLGATVTIKVRYPDFTTVTRSHTLPYPTSDQAELEAAARLLLARTDAGRRPVRLVGVGVSRLIAEDHRRQLVLPELSAPVSGSWG